MIDMISAFRGYARTMRLTLIEKIATNHAVGHEGPATAGDFLKIRPQHIMTHDNTSAVMGKFNAGLFLAIPVGMPVTVLLSSMGLQHPAQKELMLAALRPVDIPARACMW